jgi:hypothetical protein
MKGGLMSSTAHLPTNPLQRINKRIVVAVSGFVVAAVVGATTLVGAQPMDKPTKAWCQAHGYTNYGQCVKEWAHGHGYGGNTTINNVNVNTNIDTHGHDNVVNVVMKFVFGS